MTKYTIIILALIIWGSPVKGQQASIILGTTDYFMESQFQSGLGLDVGVRYAVQPSRLSIGLGLTHSNRRYSVHPTFPGYYLTSRDVLVQSWLVQAQFAYQLSPLLSKTYASIYTGIDVIVPYRTDFHSSLANGETIVENDVNVSYLTGFGIRLGFRYSLPITPRVGLFGELEGAMKISLDYAEKSDHSGGPTATLTDDRLSSSIHIGFSYVFNQSKMASSSN